MSQVETEITGSSNSSSIFKFVLGQLLFLPTVIAIIFITQIVMLPFMISGFDAKATPTAVIIGLIFRSLVFIGLLKLFSRIGKVNFRKILWLFFGIIPLILALIGNYGPYLSNFIMTMIAIGVVFLVLAKNAEKMNISLSFKYIVTFIQAGVLLFFFVVYLKDTGSGEFFGMYYNNGSGFFNYFN